MTHSKEILETIAQLAGEMEIQSAEADGGNALYLRSPKEDESGYEGFYVTTVADYWVYISAFPMPFDLDFREQKNANHPILLDLMKLNDKTKLGRFFVSEDGEIGFAVDLRIADLNSELFEEALTIVHHTMQNKLPEIAGQRKLKIRQLES